jgi:hypothetical protein
MSSLGMLLYIVTGCVGLGAWTVYMYVLPTSQEIIFDPVHGTLVLPSEV